MNCPYCGKEEEACYDDGFGLEEDVAHQTECGHCEKSYIFYTTIDISHESRKALGNTYHLDGLKKTG